MTQIIHVVIPSVTIVAGENDTFEIDEGSGPLSVVIDPGEYYLIGTGTSGDLAQAVEDALNASGVETYSVQLEWAGAWPDSTQAMEVLIEIAAGSAAISWGTFDGEDLGFYGDLSSGADHENESNPRGVWRPSSIAESANKVPRALGSQMQTVGGHTYTYDRSGTTWEDLRLVWPWLEEDIVEPDVDDEEKAESTLYRCWRRWRDGRPLKIFTQAFTTSPSDLTLSLGGVSFSCYLDGMHLEKVFATRKAPGVPFYTCEPILFRQRVTT